MRIVKAIVQYTFVFVLYAHNFKTCLLKKKPVLNDISVLGFKLVTTHCSFTTLYKLCDFHYSDSADKVVQGQGKFEEIVVASNEITASTVQLVSGSTKKIMPDYSPQSGQCESSGPFKKVVKLELFVSDCEKLIYIAFCILFRVNTPIVNRLAFRS